MEAMREQGIEHEKVFTVEWLAKMLRFDADSMAFGIAISDIRRELEQDGFYLNGYGQNGESYQILHARDNHKVMERYQRQAMDSFRRAVILGGMTDTSSLTEEEKRKHEKVLSRAAIRLALTKRSTQVDRILKGADRKLLE